MKRRTFIGSISTFLSLPFPLMRKKCPYRIVYRITEEPWLNGVLMKEYYAFYEGEECVGHYRFGIGSFGVYVNPLVALDQFTEKITEITSQNVTLHWTCEEKIGHYFVWHRVENQYKGQFPNAWCFPDKPVAVDPQNIWQRYIHVITPLESIPEEVAWKIHAMRQV